MWKLEIVCVNLRFFRLRGRIFGNGFKNCYEELMVVSFENGKFYEC